MASPGNGADVRQRARGRGRDRSLSSTTQNEAPCRTETRQPPDAHDRDAPTIAAAAQPPPQEESPLARLSAEQIEQLGPRVRRDPRRGVRGPGRSRLSLHPRDDQAAPPAGAGGARAAAGLALQAAVAGGHGVAVAGEDPGEHGDRPQRDARPVGLDERPGHQLPELGLGHGLAGGRVASLAQLRAPHVHQHPRQGSRPGLRDHAHRPAPALAPRVSAAAALQPAADGLLRVGRGGPRPRSRRDPRGREVQGAGASKS